VIRAWQLALRVFNPLRFCLWRTFQAILPKNTLPMA